MVFESRGRIVGICLAIAAFTTLVTVAVYAETGAPEPPTAADDASPPPPADAGDEPEMPPADAPADDEPAPEEPTPQEPTPAQPPAEDVPQGEAKQEDDDAPPRQPDESSSDNADESSPDAAPQEEAAPDESAEPVAPPAEEDAPPDAPGKLPTVDRAEPAPLKPQPAGAAQSRGKGEAGLLGVRPGHTTRQMLHDQWGQPKQVDKIPGGVRETFQLQEFDKVRVTILKDVVDSLAIQLEKPAAQTTIAAQLDLDRLEAVDVLNDQGRLVGQAYPERGVMFGFVQKSKPPQVFQVVVEPVDAQPFLDRCRSGSKTDLPIVSPI